MFKHEDIDDGPLTSKMHKVWCCPSCCIPCNCLFHPCRQAVSGKKKRFMTNGFDLDLAYITPNIIVHGFPAAGIEHLYRNPRYEIRRFMDTYHENNYKVFNFCCEPGRGYSPEVFHGRVERYPFKDHNTPPLETMVAFAQSAKAWLESDNNHVVNMHCKAGKGRAGLMCCVLLVRTGAAQSAIDAMDLYDRERVSNLRGLTVTSQRKFVVFYETLWRQCWGVTGNIGDVTSEQAAAFKLPDQPAYRIRAVEVLNVPAHLLSSFRVVTSKIWNFSPEKLHDSGWKVTPSASEGGSAAKVTLRADCEATVAGNFKVFVYFKRGLFGKALRLVELQHNTFFMPPSPSGKYCDFPLDQLDVKRKMKPQLGDGVCLRLHLAVDTAGEAAGLALAAPAATKGGYALVKHSGEDGVELPTILLGNGDDSPAAPLGSHGYAPVADTDDVDEAAARALPDTAGRTLSDRHDEAVTRSAATAEAEGEDEERKEDGTQA